MCSSALEVRERADWDGVEGQSRSVLLSTLSQAISPSVMIPEHRLATLLSIVQDEQITKCRYHNTTSQPSLYTDHDCLAEDFPMHTKLELRHHADEVWLLEFSRDGLMLATAGRDGLVCVYETIRWSILHEIREFECNHQGRGSSSNSAAGDERGICSIAFSPNNRHLIICSKTGELVVVNTGSGKRVAHADHFDYSVTACAWLPDSERFVVGSHGSERPLGLYSLRSGTGEEGESANVVRNSQVHSWRDPPLNPALKDTQPHSFRIADCTVNTTGTLMAAATSYNKIMLFSLDPAQQYRKITEWSMDDKLTSINFSGDGDLLLVSMNEGRVLALKSDTGELVKEYKGMTQKDYVIRSAFGGAGEGFIISGSEGKGCERQKVTDSKRSLTCFIDSRVYIWRRQTGHQVASLDAHAPGPVNAVAWHPTDPAIFASAGDDRRVRM